MLVDVRRDAHWFALDLRPEADDHAVARRVELTGRQVRFALDPAVAVHPDVAALAALLCTQPWARSLTMSGAVSPQFAEAVRQGLGIAVGPVDPTLSPRPRPASGRAGLAYSGGVDCTAALTVMPDTTAAYFLDRVVPPGGEWAGAYRKDAALHACAELAATGRVVRTVESDVEFVRTPHGFPHDLANAIPALLHADTDHLHAIGWGAILESTYQVGSLRYRPYTASPFVTGFGPAFEAVGLPVYNPVAGVSEVGTAIITRRSPYGGFAQSCMRGTVGEPCRRCWKCARKILLESALSGSWPKQIEIVRMLTRKNTPGYLRKEPLKHEGVVAYFAQRYPRRDPDDLLRLLAERVSGYDVDWLARWYAPSLDTAPIELRAPTASRLDAFLPRMTDADEGRLVGWDLGPLVASDARRAATAAFLAGLERHVAPRPADVAG